MFRRQSSYDSILKIIWNHLIVKLITLDWWFPMWNIGISGSMMHGAISSWDWETQLHEVATRGMQEGLKTLGNHGGSESKFRPRLIPWQQIPKISLHTELLLDQFSSLEVRQAYIHQSPMNQQEDHIEDQIIQSLHILYQSLQRWQQVHQRLLNIHRQNKPKINSEKFE